MYSGIISTEGKTRVITRQNAQDHSLWRMSCKSNIQRNSNTIFTTALHFLTPAFPQELKAMLTDYF